MALKNTYDTIKLAIQDVIAPQLQEIKGEIVGLKTEIRRLDEKMGSLEKRMDDGFVSIRNEISYTNRRIDEALDIRERLSALEARVAAR